MSGVSVENLVTECSLSTEVATDIIENIGTKVSDLAAVTLQEWRDYNTELLPDTDAQVLFTYLRTRASKLKKAQPKKKKKTKKQEQQWLKVSRRIDGSNTFRTRVPYHPGVCRVTGKDIAKANDYPEWASCTEEQQEEIRVLVANSEVGSGSNVNELVDSSEFVEQVGKH